MDQERATVQQLSMCNHSQTQKKCFRATVTEVINDKIKSKVTIKNTPHLTIQLI